jgi:hypothetical protein
MSIYRRQYFWTLLASNLYFRTHIDAKGAKSHKKSGMKTRRRLRSGRKRRLLSLLVLIAIFLLK